jgi:hypothetical protein
MNRNRTVAITVAVLVVMLGVFGAYRFPANAQSSSARLAGLTEDAHGDWTIVVVAERSKGSGDANGYLLNTRTGEAFFLSNDQGKPLKLNR